MPAPVVQGFLYDNLKPDGSSKTEADYRADFAAAKKLTGTNGAFSSAYITLKKEGEFSGTYEISPAIPAAIAENVTLLLGLQGFDLGPYGSASGDFEVEVALLGSAITTYNSNLSDIVIGIAVGGNSFNAVYSSATILQYIGDVRTAVHNTVFGTIPIGYDTDGTSWANSSTHTAIIQEVDFLGLHTYPWSDTPTESAGVSGQRYFKEQYDATVNAAGGKPVWVTGTGWPVSSPATNYRYDSSVGSAQDYWRDVGCSSLFGKTNTWWTALVNTSYVSTLVRQDAAYGVLSANKLELFNTNCTKLLEKTPSNKHLSTGAIAGIAVTFAAIILFGVLFGYFRYKHGKTRLAKRNIHDPNGLEVDPKPRPNVRTPATKDDKPELAGAALVEIASPTERQHSLQQGATISKKSELAGVIPAEMEASREPQHEEKTELAGIVPAEIEGTRETQQRPTQQFPQATSSYSPPAEVDSGQSSFLIHHEMSSTPGPRFTKPAHQPTSSSPIPSEAPGTSTRSTPQHEIPPDTTTRPPVTTPALSDPSQSAINDTEDAELARMKADLEEVREEKERLRKMNDLQDRERELSRAIVSAELRKSAAMKGNLS